MTNLAVTWALSQTAEGFLTVSRDAALAAYSDNLQPLIIETCYKFGATLAISQFSQAKMESTLRKQSKDPFHKFLLLKIGYAKGDSVDILSRNAEGIKFLCLASALVASGQTFEAAQKLSDMIVSTADDKELSPTIYQLKDLLDILEPRIHRYGFLDDACGYQTLIAASTTLSTTAIFVPGREAISSIVQSFRELCRIGNADAQSIKFTVGRFAPWIAAFSRMCVDTPPSIIDADSQPIITQLDTLVTICVSDQLRFENEIEIELNYAFGSISKVIDCVIGQDQHTIRATGMVGISTHAKLLLRELDFHSGLGNRAFEQALPYAAGLVKSFYARTGKQSTYSLTDYGADVLANIHSFDPFPSNDVITDLMRAYMISGDSVPSVKALENGHCLTDLSIVRLWVDQNRNFLDDKPEEEFLRRLSTAVADLFALSLLMTPGLSDYLEADLWLLHVPRRGLSEMFSSGQDWQMDIQIILQASVQEGKRNLKDMFQVETCIDWALKLLGHPASEKVNNKQWVASSFRGQVVLLRMILTEDIPQEGFASLAHFAGYLMLEQEEGRRFSYILSQDSQFVKTELSDSGPLTACLSPFQDQTVQWQLGKRADHLHLILGWTLNKNAQPPIYALTALMRAVSMGRCEHPKDQPVNREVTVPLLLPGSNRLSSAIQDNILAAVYPLHLKEDLKFLALASIAWMNISMPVDRPTVIVNRGACVNCLLSACELARCKYIIF